LKIAPISHRSYNLQVEITHKSGKRHQLSRQITWTIFCFVLLLAARRNERKEAGESEESGQRASSERMRAFSARNAVIPHPEEKSPLGRLIGRKTLGERKCSRQ